VLYQGKGHTLLVPRVYPASYVSYAVTATTPSGAYRYSDDVEPLNKEQFEDEGVDAPYEMSLTAPFTDIAHEFNGVSIIDGTAPSTNAVPAHGRARYDFRVASASTVSVFAELEAPNTGSDSYWVRMDQGAWVKWNGISGNTCIPVRNSDASNAQVVYTLTAGSHFLEFAYREPGVKLFRFGISRYNDDRGYPCEP
jgi:hypothetical protein